jgi:sulfatase maturation enzyme AslB (radical SAM superfamily)
MEFSSLCNARCPLCPRNLFGFPYNSGYEETSLSLELIKKSFSSNFINQLDRGILINGNFGDFTANLESLQIIEYFKTCNPNIKIQISTNGSARNSEFWHELGKFSNIIIEFCLDGLEDTHHLYRQDTNFNKILQNAKTYMDAGGVAIWKMIRFDHNAHQIDTARQRSIELGFSNFQLEDHGRNTGPVFDRNGKLIHTMGNYSGFTNIEDIIKFQTDPKKTYSHKPYVPVLTHNCFTKQSKSIYIAANGLIYPCCYMAFNPLTYDQGFNGFINRQIKPLVKNNSLHEYDLETCIGWFNSVESAWTKDSYDTGRLIQCDQVCGKIETT